MSEQALPNGTMQMLKELDVGDTTFREFSRGVDWARMRQMRKAYGRPVEVVPYPPNDGELLTPIDRREYSACWDDLIDAGLVKVGYLCDERGNKLTGLGWALTKKGLRALTPSEPPQSPA